MRQDQIEALDALEKASIRLEAARKEMSEASRDHTRAQSTAKRLCPHIMNWFVKEEDE